MEKCFIRTRNNFGHNLRYLTIKNDSHTTINPVALAASRLPPALKYLHLQHVLLEKGKQCFHELPQNLWGLVLLDAGVRGLGKQHVEQLKSIQYLEIVNKQVKTPHSLDKESCQRKVEHAFWHPETA
jgi:hypothetical protein